MTSAQTQTNTITMTDDRYMADLAYDKHAFEELLKHAVRLGDETLFVKELLAFSWDSDSEQPSPERVSPS